LRQFVQLTAGGNVARERQDFAAFKSGEFSRRGFQLLHVPSGDNHPVALPLKRARQGQSEAAASACNQNDPGLRSHQPTISTRRGDNSNVRRARPPRSRFVAVLKDMDSLSILRQ
jgi:hypothetical protein